MPEQSRLSHELLKSGPVGVGCAYLTEGLLKDQDRRIIDAAYGAGARHFDVAPSYGMGTAEAVLGRALAGRRAEVTIATKVGQPRNEASRSKLIMRSLFAPLRGLRRRLSTAAAVTTAMDRQLDFSVPHVSAMLQQSLERLRTDYVDAYLLHEVRPDLVTSELVDLLLHIRREGRARSIGLATSPQAAASILSAWPGIFDIVQHQWSVLDQPLPPTDLLRVTHRAILPALGPMQRWLATDAGARRRLSESVGADVAEPGRLPALLLGAAIAENVGGIVLVASRDAGRTEANIVAAHDADTVAAGRRLAQALAAERQRPSMR